METTRSLPVMEPPIEPTQRTPTDEENGKRQCPTPEDRRRKTEEYRRLMNEGKLEYTRGPF